MLDGSLVISEFMAINRNTLVDEDGADSDWIEIYNPTGATVHLDGWSLTDEADELTRWSFPAVALEPDEYLVVFASDKDRTDPLQELHTNFKLDGDGEYLALVEPGGTVSYEYAPAYPAQSADVSYGIASDPGPDVLRFFGNPTPWTVNSPGFIDFVKDTKFSVDRGFFDAPFDVAITSKTPGATIRYTLDGSEPTATHGTEYTGPINVTATTILRAVAMKQDMEPSDVDTQTYIFVDDVLAQSPGGEPPGPGWPTGNVNGQKIDYGMDPDVLTDPRYAEFARDAMLDIPSVSLVTDLGNLFDPSDGIFVNASEDGMEWERPTSIELIDPSGDAEFQVNAGLRIRGGWSRWDSNPKHAFRLLFRSEYGDAKLEFPLFGDEGVGSFDAFDLRTAQDYSWSFMADTRNTMLREVFARDVQRDMGQPYTRTRYYHLYINGQYWGIYQSQERAEASFAESYFGGDKSDYDVVKVDRDLGWSMAATDGDLQAYHRLYNAAVAGFAGDEDYFRVQGMNVDGTVNPAYERLLDVDNLMDYMISIFYTGDQDGPVSNPLGGRPNNFFAIYNRNDPDGFKFFRHDAEMSLDTGITDQTNPFRQDLGYQQKYFNPQWLNTQLSANAEYRMLFVDRTHALFFNDGELTPQQSIDRMQQRADQIDLAIIGESARWGDVEPGYAGQVTPAPRNKLDDWVPAVNRILDNFFPGRTGVVLGQFRAKGWYPNTVAPSFNQHGGWVGEGFALTMAAPAGTVYYTLDGTDPRLVGGALSPHALIYLPGMEIPLAEGTVVKARAYRGTTWSALNEAAFSIGQLAAANNVVVTEINYDPADPTPEELAIDDSWTDIDFEFIELVNVGNQTVNLAGAQFTAGISYTFPDVAELEPGEYIVVAQNPQAFAARYDTTGVLIADGNFTGRLDSNGERIRLGDVEHEDIFDFSYNDTGSWPGRPAGKGATLELLDPAAVPHSDPPRTDHLGNGENWHASVRYGGTPGTGGDVATGIVINEVLSHTDPPETDSIELVNTSTETIDLAGWYLSDDWGWDPTFVTGNYKKFRIPAHPDNVLDPGEYVVFDESDFNPTPLDPQPWHFSLNGAHGDDVWLMRADAAGNLTHFVAHAEFGAQANAANGESWGRWPDPGGLLYPMTQWTPGAPNSGPRLGSVVISEVHYNPGSITDADELEFVEIYNSGGSPVDLAHWRLRKGVDFDFVDGTMLAAGAAMVVVPFDPQSEPNLLADFLAHHNVTEQIATVGPYNGQLENNGERVQLQYPDTPPADEPDHYPGLLEDEVVYDDALPWPVTADGSGASIHRSAPATWGNDAANWSAAAPTPGSVWFGPRVVDRYVFYNGSSFDGNDLSVGEADDAAIATDKTPLMPGGVARFVNYTSYVRGVNGMMVDLADLADGVVPTEADFQFRTGNNDTPGSWAQVTPDSVTVRPTAGGTDRVTILFNAAVVRNTWLEVTVAAAGLGLPGDDVFYFGNALAETGNSRDNAQISTADLLLVRNNPRDFISPAAVDFPYDFDRNGSVNAVDVLLARNNQTSFFDALELIEPSKALEEPAEASLLELAWLCDRCSQQPSATSRAGQEPTDVERLMG